MLNLRNKRGFTIIELIVVIAVLGILVLFGMPKLLSYVNQARLVRIQHDTRIMEDAMEVEFQHGITQQWKDWDINYKNLFNIVIRNQLFETEGVAERVDMSYMKYQPFIAANPDVNPKLIIAAMNGKLDEKELPILNTNFEFALGGPEIKEKDSKDATKDIPHTDYRVIPANFKSLIGTRLKGSFYVNALGKVYYEPDKPLKLKGENEKEKLPNCQVALPDYEFEHITGTITNYYGTAQHLIIPPAFLVDGKCWPVKIIGKAAFMQGGYKSIVIKSVIIPPTVEVIEEDAFKDNELTDSSAIIQRPEGSVTIGPGAFDNNGPSKDSQVNPTYKPPYDNPLVKPKYDSGGKIIGGTIIAGGGNSGYRGSGGSGSTGGSGDSGGGGGSGGVLVIPPTVIIGGEEVPVTEVAAGSYQGLGLITVIMPEGLERIEDYAFAGNQLIGITIPNSVNYIGNYAFAFNEVHKLGNIPGPDSIATIKNIILKDLEQFNKVNKYGDIYDLDNKVDIFSVVGQEGPNITLKNYMWVTSIGNIVIEEEYVKGMEPGGQETVPKPPEDDGNNGLTNPVSSRDPVEGEIAIDSADKLAKIGKDKDYPLSGKYILTSDIDLSGINWTPIGNDSSKFTGSFNGNGYNITGLIINRPGTNYVGLFGSTEGAIIENVALEDIDITGGSFTGGLVGEANGANITNSYATGSVIGRDYTGGLVGYANSASILNSYATGSVSVTGTGSFAGGLVGYANSLTITNSYATGSVTGKDRTGGLVGYDYSSRITNSYWDTETTGQTNSAGGLGKSTEDMKTKDTYTDWDFINIWTIDEGASYPTLR